MQPCFLKERQLVKRRVCHKARGSYQWYPGPGCNRATGTGTLPIKILQNLWSPQSRNMCVNVRVKSTTQTGHTEPMEPKVCKPPD